MNILGFDPGRDKCGVAVVEEGGKLHYHEVVLAENAIAIITQLLQQYQVAMLVMGNQTTAKSWKQQISNEFPDLEINLVDERYSSLEARDRYWQMYPPNIMQRLIPQGMRLPPRPIDDLVAILLIERYLANSS